MEDKTQKERLEQELRFLKESFEAEVISKEEFEKGKDRVDKKLKEIQSSKPSDEEAKTEPEEEKLEEIKKTEETKSDIAIETKEEEKIELKAVEDKTNDEQEQAQKIEQKEPAIEEPKTEIKEEKKESKLFRYAIIFVVLVLVVFFSYSFFKAGKPQEKTSELKFFAVCSSDQDCKQEGKEGFCLQPGTINAKCEFKGIPKISVIVLNDRKNCFNCDTQRVLNILESWFGPINAKEIDYNTNDGKNLVEMIDAKLLPTYVLDENITNKPAYEQFNKVFIKKNSNYILSEDAAGSTFYFKRDDIPNKLDLFVISGDSTSIKAENNLKEFLDAFKEVKFEKHLSNDKFTQELGIKNFPAFLINNRVKFSGIYTAETIKENFCSLNKVEECKKTLSKNLV